jgi:hypothetical protein
VQKEVATAVASNPEWAMGKNTGKMIGIKKMMKRSTSCVAPVAEPSAKRSRKGEAEGPREGISGDILEGNFMVENLAAGDDGDVNALDGGSDVGSGDEDRERVADNKKRKHEALKEKKRAKAGEAPRREDSLAVAAASAAFKADFFLVCSLSSLLGPCPHFPAFACNTWNSS